MNRAHNGKQAVLLRKEIFDIFAKIHIPDKQTLLVLGGSLGAKKINQLIRQHLDDMQQHNIQLIWQGKGSRNPFSIKKSSSSYMALNRGINFRNLYINHLYSLACFENAI